MKKFINTNSEYGMSGPFEAESADELADEMMPTFREWANQSIANGRLVLDLIDDEIQCMRDEFLAGLEEIA